MVHICGYLFSINVQILTISHEPFWHPPKTDWCIGTVSISLIQFPNIDRILKLVLKICCKKTGFRQKETFNYEFSEVSSYSSQQNVYVSIFYKIEGYGTSTTIVGLSFITFDSYRGNLSPSSYFNSPLYQTSLAWNAERVWHQTPRFHSSSKIISKS